MPWVQFEYISVASRNHTRDECTASAVGGAFSGTGTAKGTVTGVPLRNSFPSRGPGRACTRPGPSDYGVIVVCSSMTLVASINAPI
jgi:hypothetical protein